MKLTVSKIIHIILSLSLSIYGYSQSLDQAKILYSEGRYAEAKPAFEKLVRQSPNNSSYNQWYGVCCYETGDLENAEKYLLVANIRKVMESYRYLAMIYTQTGRYGTAIPMWEEYIEMQIKKKEDATESGNSLKQVEKLARMVHNTEDIQVIDSIVIDKSDILTAYSFSEEGGSLATYDIFFGVSDNVSSTVYKNQKGDKIFYARPSENQIYSLYSQSKLLDTFGDEKLLLSDQTADCNYPFVLSDGITMYFASKGYGSIGGYDIFVTRYNLNTNAFLSPEQMGMPFNSLANDYMMVIDEAKNLGWFATDRNQPEDKVCVYLFIPEETKKNVNIENSDLLRVRASLSSIASTWKEGADYSELIKLAHKAPNRNQAMREKDFTFIVNDKTVYYKLDEITSDGTKELYSQYLEKTKQIDLLKKKLEDLRDTFRKENPSKRKQLSAVIIGSENNLYRLMEEARMQEKQARNAENKRLGIKY
ncbi:MAG: tetratricopeptide repeat protein [Tannerella sp.]|jgi:tetratricopeptide (TPR) repeat protein|nr:tetratricopeptide repeat protein [Tannerella sp.]